MSRRDWFRVRVRWYTDPDHADLPGDSLHIGPFLMMLADGDPDWRDTDRARFLGPDGRGLTLTQLALRAKWTPTRMRKALEPLLECRTLEECPDGGYQFRNYRKHQEDPSSKRKRKQRDSHAPERPLIPRRVTVEAEAEAEEKKQTPPLPPQAGARGWDQVAIVVDRLPWLNSPPGLPKLLCPQDRIHTRVMAGATADEIIAVVQGLSRAIAAGDDGTSRNQWNAQYVFSGHFDALRIKYANTPTTDDKPRKSLAERVAELDEAER